MEINNVYTNPVWAFDEYTPEETAILLKHDTGEPASGNDYRKKNWAFSGCSLAETRAVLAGELIFRPKSDRFH